MLEKFEFYFFLLVLFTIPAALHSQAPIDTTEGPKRDGLLQDIFQEPDSFKVSYFHIDNPKKIFYYSDTLLGNYFHQPQPSRSRDLERINLGNLGTPTQNLVFEPGFREGFDVGLNQFDTYRRSSEELAFYKIDNAFTDASFAQGRSREDQYLTTIFSRNFGEQINFTLDLQKINHAGVYKNQRSKHTAFATGIWYHHPNGSYDGHLIVNNNGFFQGHNGGIDSTLLSTNNQLKEELVPIQLEGTVTDPKIQGQINATAQTRYQSREVAYAHYFTIGGPPKKRVKKPKKRALPISLPDSISLSDSLLINDSLQLDSLNLILPTDTLAIDSLAIDALFMDSLSIDSLSMDTSLVKNEIPDSLANLQGAPVDNRKVWKRDFQIYHKINFNSSWYKFSDTRLTAAAPYYGTDQVHNKGLRYFIRTRTLENTFRIGTSKKESSDTGQKGRFEVGLIHRLIRLDQEPLDKVTVNNLLLTGTWNFAPTPQLSLQTYAHYGLWKNAGDYYVGGTLQIDFGKIGQFEAKAIQQHYSPTLVQSSMYITSQKMWENDFSKTFETTLSATYRIPTWGTEVSGQYHLLNNYIYFDLTARPQQSNLGINIPQLIVKQKLKWKNFHFDNIFTWQLSSAPEVLPLPNLYGKHSLYAEGKIFNKIMLARLGIDFLWNSNYEPNAYQHLFGQFHLQNEETLGFYPQADVSFSMKVKTLRAFVKGENVTRFLISDFVYRTPDHPIPFFVLRFGLSWRFLN